MSSGVYERKRIPLEDRFWAKVDKKGPADCWEWTAAKSSRGYGWIRGFNQQSLQAHRVSWEIHNGPIPEGKCVLHHCDNRSCVNPYHLWIGSHTDNMHDMIEKGRDKHDISPRGENHGRSKLSKQDVHEIRVMLAQKILQRVIAKKYGVSRVAITNINTGKTWGWLE